MFQRKIERKMKKMMENIEMLEIDNKVLLDNPLPRNKKQVLLDISYLRKRLNEYSREVKDLPCKYEYPNRGKRD